MAVGQASGVTNRVRRSLVHHHDFRSLWIGDTISQAGTQLSLLALPVIAVQLLHAGPTEMGLLTGAETLAFLLIGLPAGAWVDRWRTKRVLIGGDLVRAAALLTIPVAWWLDLLTLPQLYAIALVTGVATVFFDVAYQSYLPALVEPADVVDGNAKLQASQSIAQVGGPAIGGGLLRLVSAPALVVLDAASFLGSAFLVWRIQQQDTPPPRHERRRLRTEIAEGLSFVLRHPLLVRITACTSLGNLFISMGNALFVLLLLRYLHQPTSAVGLLFSAAALGGLAGALATRRIVAWVGEGRTISLSAVAWTPVVALTPLAAELAPGVPPMPLLAVGGFMSIFLVVVYNITQVSFRQRVCPPRLLGRMNATVRFIVWGTQPIGAVAGGLLGTHIGIVPTFWISVGGTGLAALPVLFSPLTRMRDLPDNAELQEAER